MKPNHTLSGHLEQKSALLEQEDVANMSIQYEDVQGFEEEEGGSREKASFDIGHRNQFQNSKKQLIHCQKNSQYTPNNRAAAVMLVNAPEPNPSLTNSNSMNIDERSGHHLRQNPGLLPNESYLNILDAPMTTENFKHKREDIDMEMENSDPQK